MKELNKIIKPIKMPDNVSLSKDMDKEPLIFIPNDKSYVEILGHRINRSFESFESFCEYLNKVKQMEVENDQLKKELDDIYNKKAAIIDYLVEKIESAALERTYEQGMCFRSMRECIYEDVLEEIEKIMEGKDENNKNNRFIN